MRSAWIVVAAALVAGAAGSMVGRNGAAMSHEMVGPLHGGRQAMAQRNAMFQGMSAHGNAQAQRVNLPNGFTDQSCQMCQFVVTFVVQYAEQLGNDSINGLVKNLTQLCQMLPPSYAQTCKSMVGLLTAAVIQALENETPVQGCQSLGFCNSNAVAANPLANAEVAAALNRGPKKPAMLPLNPNFKPQVAMSGVAAVDLVRPQADDSNVAMVANALSNANGRLAINAPPAMACPACVLAVTYVSKYIASNPNATIEQIEDALHKLCNNLGSTYAATCNNIVDQDIPLIIQALEDANPQTICQELHLCQTGLRAHIYAALSVMLQNENPDLLA